MLPSARNKLTKKINLPINPIKKYITILNKYVNNFSERKKTFKYKVSSVSFQK